MCEIVVEELLLFCPSLQEVSVAPEHPFSGLLAGSLVRQAQCQTAQPGPAESS